MPPAGTLHLKCFYANCWHWFGRAEHEACSVGSPFSITLAQNVEEEGVHIIVESFVVQEQFAEQAQALAVHLVLLAIHLTQQDYFLKRL